MSFIVFKVCHGLGFYINHSWFIIAPAIDQDANACDCKRSII